MGLAELAGDVPLPQTIFGILALHIARSLSLIQNSSARPSKATLHVSAMSGAISLRVNDN